MPSNEFADRMARVGFSPSLAVIARVREMRAQGVDVIDFGRQAPPPEIAMTAAAEMMRSPASAFYTDSRGLAALRHTIAEKLGAENAIDADPDTEIVVTVGAKQALFAALLALVDRGDEVLLEDPGYLSFEPLVRLAGATPIRVPLHASDGFRFPVERARRLVTPRTRVLLLCNPHNPTGRCLTRAELAEIAALARQSDLWVLMDEAYEHFVYDGARHVSMAALPEMKPRTLTVQTVSKVYNMGGWRVGWVMGPPDAIAQILAVHTHSVTCPTSFAQAGVQAVVSARVGEGGRPIPEIVARYERQRQAMVDGLCAIAGVSCVRPQGAYFVFPDFSSFGLSSSRMSDYLLETAHVATVAGSAFGAAGEGHLRMVIKSEVDEIARGVDRIARALERLRSRGPGDAEGVARGAAP